MVRFMFRQALRSTQRRERGLGAGSRWRPEDSWVIHSELLLLWQRSGGDGVSRELSTARGFDCCHEPAHSTRPTQREGETLRHCVAQAGLEPSILTKDDPEILILPHLPECWDYSVHQLTWCMKC